MDEQCLDGIIIANEHVRLKSTVKGEKGGEQVKLVATSGKVMCDDSFFLSQMTLGHVPSGTPVAPHVGVSNLEGKGPTKALAFDLDQSLEKCYCSTQAQKEKTC